MSDRLQGNLGFSLMQATEAAALVASRWVGRGKTTEADRAVSATMHSLLEQVDIAGRIVIGERPENVDPEILGAGVEIGTGNGPRMDVVVDSVEGVKLLAQGLSDAISVVALAPYGTISSPSVVPYMEKIAVSAKGASALQDQAFDAPVPWTLGLIASALNKRVPDLTIFVLNRQRHKFLIEDLRETGARVILRPEGDLLGAVLAALPDSSIDIMMGTGGTAEGVVAACAVRAMGGEMLMRPAPRDNTERAIMAQAGYSEDQVLTSHDLVSDDNIYFAATGITDGLLLNGVRYHSRGATTHSIMLHGQSKIRRLVHADHHREELEALGGDKYKPDLR